MRSETFYTKRIKLIKQYNLYFDFLFCSTSDLTREQKDKLIFEMGRIKKEVERISKMALYETQKITDDYPLVIPSGLNEKIKPLKV
ncbi:MAG: hypothetical protein CMC76_12110 [Flavobacteriaceae bacterium]|nr:hypothetical protein [Flavobacteriaceae bacterium]|tara:strand:+ start:6436 stop:6693 length:258 start_codon:yes stop_codon:yes gene_type:complete